MPTPKHAAHRETDDQGITNAAPPSQAGEAMDMDRDTVASPQAEEATEMAAPPQAEGTMNTAAPPQAEVKASSSAEAGVSIDDLQVPWRKEKATGSAQAPAEAATAGEGAVDWQARFKAEQAKADDYFAKWQRAAADLANMRRRHEQERQEYMKQANAMLIAELLQVLDSFDRALVSMPPDLRELTWIDGIVLVERQLRMVLEHVGLTPIEAEGKPFNPTEHEALLHEESDKPEDTVIGELQKGYKLYDRVLRPALVKVAKK